MVATAWCRFDGSTTPPTILDSFNVDSVDRIALGNFRINFSVSFANANYVALGTAGDNNTIMYNASLRNYTVDDLIFEIADNIGNNNANTDTNSLVVFGGN